MHCCQQSVFLSRRTRKSTEGLPPPPSLSERSKDLKKKNSLGMRSSYIAFSLFLSWAKAYIVPSYGRPKEREPTSSCASFHLDFCRRKPLLLPSHQSLCILIASVEFPIKEENKVRARRYESERL